MISKNVVISVFLIIISHFCGHVQSLAPECGIEENGGCIDKKAALILKIIAIVAILVTSMIGLCLPLVTRSVKVLSPERNLFVVVKAFAAGIILGTGFMHVLPDSFEMLSSSCLLKVMATFFKTQHLHFFNPVKGKLCHGFFSKQLDDSISKESGKTCMNPVPRIIPAANAFTTTNKLRSGLSAFTERVTNGKQRPIILVTRIATMAMIFKISAAFLSMQPPFSSMPHSGARDWTWPQKCEIIIRKTEMTTFFEIIS